MFSGCTNNSIDYYGDKSNKMDLRNFFDGEIEGWGSLFDFNGRQTRSFKVEIKGKMGGRYRGTWRNGLFLMMARKLKEYGEYPFLMKNSFVGSAGDVIGEAKGKINGNAVNLNYVLNIPL
jgi:hypothetical protein